MASALETLSKHGWIDDASAVRLAFKFAGETIQDTQVAEILSQPSPQEPTP
jgi:SRSO17 transposase